ncbi:DUF2934 domain-containing protein [Azotobacter armeniacus]
MTSDEQRIRELAYQIWQSEGCPDGQQDRHWQMACKLAEAELQASAPEPRTRKSATMRKAGPATKPVEVPPAANGEIPAKPARKKPRATRTRPLSP